MANGIVVLTLASIEPGYVAKLERQAVHVGGRK